MFKQASREALILILAAVGIALIVYWIRPDKIAAPSPAAKQAEVRTDAAMSGFSEIPLPDARRRFEEGSAVFADARHTADFTAGHIQGAVNLPLDDQERWLAGFLAATDPSTMIITYCDGEGCQLAMQLAEFLYFNGFDRVSYLKNGWTRWRESGFPVE